MPVSLAVRITLSLSFLAFLQSLQRFGGFWRCLSRKNTCSPIVQVKSFPQSIQPISASSKSGAAAKVAWLNSFRLFDTTFVLPRFDKFKKQAFSRYLCWKIDVFFRFRSNINLQRLLNFGGVFILKSRFNRYFETITISRQCQVL